MSVTLDEVHLGLGGFSADFNWSPTLARWLVEYNQLRVWWGEKLIYLGVILTPDTAKSGITVSGRGPGWYLGGADSIGPLIEDREFVAGNNKLDNPLTPASIAAVGDLDWTFAEGSLWILTPNYVFHANPPFAEVDADDVLACATDWEVAPGQLHTFSVVVTAGPATFGGRIRVRRVYKGTFATPNIGQPYAAWGPATRGDIVATTDALIGGPVFRIQTAIANMIPNFTFEDGITGWAQGGGNWYTGTAYGGWTGSGYYTFTNSSTTPQTKMLSSGPNVIATAYPVAEGEEYEFWSTIRTNPAFTDTDGEAYAMLGIFDVEPLPPIPPTNMASQVYLETDHVVGYALDSDAGRNNWHIQRGSYTIQAGQTVVSFYLMVTNQTLGQWDFDNPTLIRVKGNFDSRTGPYITVTPKRSYTWSLPFRSDQSVTSGTVQMRLICSAAGRPDVTLHGPTLEPTEGEKHDVQWSFQPPSGYDLIRQQIYVADVRGGAYIVGQGTIVDDDNTTVFRDGLSPPASSMYGGGTVVSYGIAPEGAERMGVELVAENLAGQWSAGNVSLRRVGVPLSTSAEVVHALLIDPVTGSQLLRAGTIVGPEVIQYDWRVRNLHCADALAQLSRSGVALPVREWLVRPDPDNPAPGALYDWGTAEQLFVDRADMVFTEGSFFLRGELRQSRNVEDAATVVRLIGADRTTSGGTRRIITAEAANVLPGAVDGNGVALSRVSVVEDSTVDNIGYAGARARSEADARATKRSNIPVVLSDWKALGTFGVGDWLYFFDRAAGIEDLAIEKTLENGRVVNPVRERVARRSWSLAAGSFRLEVRNPSTGEILEVDPGDVRWSEATSASLELGDLRPTFVGNAQGGAVGNQFLRFRASSPR